MLKDERERSHSRHKTVCNLSIHGEGITTTPVHPDSAYDQRSGEMDIGAVHQACTPKGMETGRRFSRAVTGPKSCSKLSPECRGEKNLRDFDAYLKDDRGRVVSTKTPVAKMTAPISPVKIPRADKQDAGNRNENSSSSKSAKATSLNRKSSLPKFEDDSEVRDVKQDAGELDENNSSNKKAAASARASDTRAGSGKRQAGRSSSQRMSDTDDKENELHNVENAERESLTTFHPEERRRRSPSLQVGMRFLKLDIGTIVVPTTTTLL